ncbi:trans-sulfuration enzyme family protein [Sporosarcina ureilytica]|uniref:L-methionine gamma-lyase n=1 Tax=Sporosarcina ureilytica TaxID=298596 RepID=A0A1D8JIV9_9BACL|nr:aminotransferase class I/II-fold pyridoxal phosphate-dependent enzyme [Sporosarcina ureilytica]AOV08637.1 methionine gamma-lyase [Sporosarcina ureilytica]
MKKLWSTDTNVIHSLEQEERHTGVISQSITPAVAYSFPSAENAAAVVQGEIEGIYYGRYGNPTTIELERQIAKLENGEAALGVSSGMAAISISLLAYLQHGDHVLVTKDVYGGTFSFLQNLAPRFGIDYDYIDCTDPTLVEKSIKENTKVLYIETPSNPGLTVLDIAALSAIGKKNNLKVIIDNTFMTPYLQRPIDMGVDVVVHSGTKYLNGHGDVIAGFIVGKKDEIDMMRKKIMGDLGQNLNSWESYLIMRGLKTLPIRMQRHCNNALEIAEFLEQHPAVEKVFYPGLPSHPQYELAKEQMKAMGGIVSFELKGGVTSGRDFINNLKLCLISFSLGDPETLVQHPASMTHSAIPEDERMKYGISDGLIRLSSGLEDPKDIIADLKQSLDKIATNEKKLSLQL